MTDNVSAGATPAAVGATPTQTAAADATPEAPATGTEALGEAGTRALKAEREAAKAALKRAEQAEKDLEALKLAGASEAEKAIAAAKAEGAASATGKYQAIVRRSEVRAALAAAGISPSVLDLAAKADEFGALTVTDDGAVEGLDGAITAFRAERPDLFKTPVQAGTADLGTGTSARSAAGKTFTREQFRDPVFFQANKDDILAAQRAGRIT
ncbi:MAG TPA: hypothetical protein VMX12_03090 [Acidimicrobiia bacterium]|nr:hypothetical protein [Acidimicrobiia bacterium]